MKGTAGIVIFDLEGLFWAAASTGMLHSPEPFPSSSNECCLVLHRSELCFVLFNLNCQSLHF